MKRLAIALAIASCAYIPAALFAQGPAKTTKAPAPVAAPTNPLQSFLDSLNKKALALNAFTMEDAQAAMTMAANDPVGLACYTAIAAKLANGGVGNLIPKKLGLLQLIESARLAKLQASAVQTGVDPVVQGCAGLILDANTTLLMLTGQGALMGVGL